MLLAMNTSTANTSTEDRALELLATGYGQVEVAGALGVTEGRISQILSNPLFAEKLAELKFTQLRKHNETDNKYDTLEQKVLAQLERTLSLVMDPMKLATILTRLNQAKRRGSSAPDSLVRQRATIRLNINSAVVARFAVNGANQVVQASVGDASQDLVTIQSGGVQRLLNEHVKSIQQQQPLLSGSTGETEGKVWRKPQGREKHDLLTECGFAHEIGTAHEINVTIEQSAEHS